jgi:microcystin-dependent protein
LGSKAGAEKVTLTVNQLPSHTHRLQATQSTADNRQPVGLAPATSTGQVYSEIFDPQQMSSESIGKVGGSRSHTNLMPFLCIHFIIALVGIYPSRH